ncbi:MAG: lamin tail domain-containing protein [Chitinophagales bacterium]
MKQIYTLLALCLLFQVSAHSQCTDLFFSEYIEGSGNNKALEIYNPTDAPINLGTYQINRYNGGVTATSGEFNFPDGRLLGPGEVYIIANSQADSAGILAKADTTSSITFYNGDDAMELIDTVTGNAIDIIGVIGEDPGTNWPVGAGATSEFTLVRNANVNDGQTDWVLGALEWDVYPQNFFDSLGTHSINSCGVVIIPPIVSFSSISDNVLENAGTATVSVNISNLTSAVDLEIVTDASSTAGAADGSVSNLGTYSFASGGNDTSITLTFTINDDSEVEGNETFVLKLINITSGVTVSSDTYTLTILDDDVAQNNPCSDIFFSEYIEGSSNNKALEIYNPTDAAIHLGKYHINRYNGGVTVPSGTFRFPEGMMLAAGEVYVIANSQADSAGVLSKADTTSAITFYNGDDAMELIDTSTNTQIDIIGVIGEDPGTNWPVGSGATSEFTLVRKASINEGYTNWAASVATWDVYPQDSFTFLGIHTMTPCDSVPDVCEGVTISVTGVVTNETIDGANDGAIDITVSGGTMPYTFSWDNSSIMEDLSGLADGEYCVTVTDSNGCASTITCFDVEKGAGPCDTTTITVTGTATDETVLGAEDGEIDITVSGGVEPYTYSWNNGAMIEDISDLADGTYTVTVTDANGCEGTNTFTVNPGVDPCAGVTIAVTLSVTDESVSGASDGAIDATVTGGATPYTYSWSNSAITEDISGLAPNTYTLTVTDANGCTGTATGTVDAGSVGVNDIASLKVFNVYPNPIANILNVQLQFANAEKVQLEITDLMGRNVFSLQPEQVTSKIYTIYPDLPSGIYFLKVMVEGSIAVEPIVVR